MADLKKITHVIFDLDGLLLGIFTMECGVGSLYFNYHVTMFSICTVIVLFVDIKLLYIFPYFSCGLASSDMHTWDTETIYSECIGIIVARYNKVLTPFLKIQMMGRPRLESAKILIDGLELPLTPEDFTEELYSMLYERFPRASLLPGK